MKIKKEKSFISSFLFLLLIVFLIFALIFGTRYICYKKDVSSMPIHSVNTKDKRVSLTFDAGWESNNIKAILDVLEKHNVKATFFLVGNWAQENKDIVKEISDKGHEIGNHSDTHASLKNLSKDAKIKEIKLASEKISQITGQQPTLFRPPFGDVDKETMEVCNTLGYDAIKWNIDSMDWKELGPNHVIDRVLKNVEPGSIVLFHPNVRNISDSIDAIISNLKKDGYEIVPVSKITYKEKFEIDSNGVQKSK